MFNVTGPLSLVVNLSGSPEKHYLNIVSASSHSWHKMVYDSNTPMLFSHLAQATLSCSWNLGIALCKPFTSASSMFKGCAMSTGQQHQVSLRKVGHFHWSKFFMVRCSESHDSFHVWCRICRSSSAVQIGCGIKDNFVGLKIASSPRERVTIAAQCDLRWRSVMQCKSALSVVALRLRCLLYITTTTHLLHLCTVWLTILIHF